MESSFEQLKSMAVFASIVDQGSFSAASKALSISRASVTYHVKKLEKQLGVTLFYRSTRSINLTDAGSRYYERCRAVVTQASQAQQEIESFKQEPEGKLRVTSPVGVGTALIVPMVSEFKSLYSRIEIELLLTDSIVNLIADGVDIGIRGAMKPMVNSELQSLKLSPQSLCICASPDYLEKHGRPVSPLELEKHHWVIYTTSSKTFSLSQGNKAHQVNMQGSISVNHAKSRTQLVLDGHGLGKLPMYDANSYLESGQLERVLSEYEMSTLDMYAVFPAGASQQKKVRLFLDHIKNSFAQLEAKGKM